MCFDHLDDLQVYFYVLQTFAPKNYVSVYCMYIQCSGQYMQVLS